MKEKQDKIKKNLKILEKYSVLTDLGHPIPLENMRKDGFDLGFSDGMCEGPKGEESFSLGSYAYYIDKKTTKVSIWKFKGSQ